MEVLQKHRDDSHTIHAIHADTVHMHEKYRVTSGEIHTFDAPFLLGFCSKCYMDMDMDVDVDVDVDVFAYGCGSGTHDPHAILLGTLQIHRIHGAH